VKIPTIEFDVKDVARINRISHTDASYTIHNWYLEGLIKLATDKTWVRADG